MTCNQHILLPPTIFSHSRHSNLKLVGDEDDRRNNSNEAFMRWVFKKMKEEYWRLEEIWGGGSKEGK